MTTDTKAIRAQVEALAGFTPGPWNADLGETYRVKADGMNIATANFVTLLDRIPTDQVRQNARLIAAAPDMRETILTLCDAQDSLCNALDEAHAENERLKEENERLYVDRAVSLGHKDRNGNPPLTKEELKAFCAANQKDHIALVAMAAWVNVRPDQLPAEMRAHNCPATKEAWDRVGKAILNLCAAHSSADSKEGWVMVLKRKP